MEIDHELLETYKSVVGLQEDEKVLCCVTITTWQKKKKIKGILIATEFQMFLLEKVKGKASIIIQMFWNSLTKIEHLDMSTFEVTGQNGSVKVCHQAMQYFMKIIVGHLGNVLTPSEMPKLEGALCARLAPAETEHSKEAFINRFRFLLRLTNQSENPDFIKVLNKIIGKVRELDIPSLPGSDRYVDILLQSM